MNASPLVETVHAAPADAAAHPGTAVMEAVGIDAGFGDVRVLDNVSIRVDSGEIVGLIGESGSGKTTLGRLLMKMLEPAAGDVLFRGRSLADLQRSDLKAFRRKVQMVFQNPYGSLHPLRKIGAALEEVFEIHDIGDRRERRRRAIELLEGVGLSAADADKYPAEFSGGQRQRIAIARAIALGPELVIADEPVSALDVSVQAQILNLLKDLNAAEGLAVLFISHDLSVVQYLCDRVLVMYLGTIVESGDAEQVLSRPVHPYTVALRQSAPSIANAGRTAPIVPAIDGEIPGVARRPSGCPFHARCRRRMAVADGDRCVRERPVLKPVPGGGAAACHFPDAPDA